MNQQHATVLEKDYETTLRKIGIARYVGRINSGFIDADEGYKALEAYMAKERERPLLSRLAAFILHKEDPYLER